MLQTQSGPEGVGSTDRALFQPWRLGICDHMMSSCCLFNNCQVVPTFQPPFT